MTVHCSLGWPWSAILHAINVLFTYLHVTHGDLCATPFDFLVSVSKSGWTVLEYRMSDSAQEFVFKMMNFSEFYYLNFKRIVKTCDCFLCTIFNSVTCIHREIFYHLLQSKVCKTDFVFDCVRLWLCVCRMAFDGRQSCLVLYPFYFDIFSTLQLFVV